MLRNAVASIVLGLAAVVLLADTTLAADEERQPAQGQAGSSETGQPPAGQPQADEPRGAARERQGRRGAQRGLPAEFEKCAQACNDCQRICDTCVTHCAEMVAQGHKDHLRTLQTCQDCAQVCAVAAQIVSRQGPFAALICQACADACARCGEACEAHENDPLMRQCAEECRRCEKACRAMAQHAGGSKSGQGGHSGHGDHSDQGRSSESGQSRQPSGTR